MKDKSYNIYIVNYKTNIASSKIGENLSETQAEKRIMTGLMRCNEEYGVYDVEVGSKEDLKYKNDINEK